MNNFLKASGRLGSYSQTLSICLFCCAKPEYDELGDLPLAKDCKADAGAPCLAWWDLL